jgi:hypothetical protein
MSTTASVGSAAGSLKSVLQKPSKVLTVGLEYAGSGDLSATELSILSMQLRKSKVSAIWCAKVEALQEFVAEQEMARGNFPGPCPIIFHGPVEQTAAAVTAGASAVVLPVDAEIVDGCDIVWKVSSVEEVESVLETTDNLADAFWLDVVHSETLETVVAAVPKGAMCIASLDAMQPDGAEVDQGRELKRLGCASVFVRQACVGDGEDLEYAQFLVGALTSKASSEFSFSGLTGSTNGHFGGIQANGTVKWKRVEEQES